MFKMEERMYHGKIISFGIGNDLSDKFFHQAQLRGRQILQPGCDLTADSGIILLFRSLDLHDVFNTDLKNGTETDELFQREIPFTTLQLRVILRIKSQLLRKRFLRHVIQKTVFHIHLL